MIQVPPPSSARNLAAALLLATALLASVALPLWGPLLLAAVVGTALMGWQDRLARQLGGRRALAAGILLLAVVLLAIGPLTTVATVLVKQVVEAAHAVRDVFAHEGLEGLLTRLPEAVQGIARRAAARLPSSWEGISQRLAAGGTAAAGFASNALSWTSNALFDSAMTLVALFFLLVDGRRLVAWLRSISPLGPETTGRVIEELRRTAVSVLLSVVLTALVQGAVATLGYWIAGIPQPLVFGLLTFFAAFIPSVGTSIVALPLAGALLVSGHLVAGLFLAAWGLLVTGTIDNVLKPVLARRGGEVPIHGAVVFFAMIGGILMYGGPGILLGPLAVSLLLALVRAGRADFAARRAESAVIVAPQSVAPPPAAPEPMRHDA